MRIAYLLALLPAIGGVVLGAVAYFVPESGVDGTSGALLATVGALLVSLGILLAMMPVLRGWALSVLNTLIGLGAVLTALAAWFLMQNAFAAIMTMAFLGLLLALAFPLRRTA